MVLPHIDTAGQLTELVHEVGMLPLFGCGIPGFSVMDITDPSSWWTDDPSRDPWQWRMSLASGTDVVYSKLFHGKAGFISRECYPDFVNFRRDGYDFDSLFEDGKAPLSSMDIMKLFLDSEEELPSYLIKKYSGLQKGFQGALVRLQMQTYLTVCGFSRKKNKNMEEYGWHTAVLCTPEHKYGREFVRSSYKRGREQSFLDLVRKLSPYVGADAKRLLSA